MSHADFNQVSDLPDVIPIFPLGGALLFPRGVLPLNIFEPRYLNMIDDAMTGNRLIGMVQTLGTGPKSHPDIADVGTLGHIGHFSETEDGRYLITLQGVCRFQIAKELPLERPYRQARTDWSDYVIDLDQEAHAPLPDKQRVLTALSAYLSYNNMQADWDSVEDAPVEALINALAASCPFSTMEKQALLEAVDLNTRNDCLIALLEIDTSNKGGSKWLQ